MSGLSPDERIKLQRQCVDEHLRTESGGDWAALYDTFVDSDQAFCDVMPLNTTMSMKDFYDVIRAAFAELHFDVTGEYDVPGCSIREITITATQHGEYCGVPSTGRQATVEAAVFFLFDDANPDRTVAERAYFDNETLLRQLRGDKDAPAGVGLAGRVRSTT